MNKFDWFILAVLIFNIIVSAFAEPSKFVTAVAWITAMAWFCAYKY